MKVHELIEALKEMPQDMEVCIYCEADECDGMVSGVSIAHPHDKYKHRAKEYYCKGDSIPAFCCGLKEWVVIEG